MSAAFTSYDSQRPLECCEYPRLDRQIGVRAGHSFHHRGMGAEYIYIARQTVTVNTATYGNYYPAETADAEMFVWHVFEAVPQVGDPR